MRMIAAPATGRNVIRVRIWLLIKSKEDLLRSERFYQVYDQHAARQDEDIVVELAGLEPAEEGAAADRDVRDAVHRAVDHGIVDLPRQVGEPDAQVRAEVDAEGEADPRPREQD